MLGLSLFRMPGRTVLNEENSFVVTSQRSPLRHPPVRRLTCMTRSAPLDPHRQVPAPWKLRAGSTSTGATNETRTHTS